MKAEKAKDIFGWCALHAIGYSDDQLSNVKLAFGFAGIPTRETFSEA